MRDAIREVQPGTFQFAVVKTAITLGTFCPCNRGFAVRTCAGCELALCQECFDRHVCIPRRKKDDGRYTPELARPVCRECGRALWSKDSREKGVCGLCEIRRVPE